MALPTVAGTLGVAGPVYIRKLRRRGDWGYADDANQPQRVRDAVDKVFFSTTNPHVSLYLIESDDDLRRVALGLNAGRDSLKEAICFVALLPDELSQCGISAMPTPGTLTCPAANRLHHDTTPTVEQLTQLCDLAMKNGRDVGHCSKGMMNDVIDRAKSEKCLLVDASGPCTVGSCN